MLYLHEIGKGKMNLARFRRHGSWYIFLVFVIATTDFVVPSVALFPLAESITKGAPTLPSCMLAPLLLIWAVLLALGVPFGAVLTLLHFKMEKRFVLGWILLSMPIIAVIIMLYRNMI